MKKYTLLLGALFVFAFTTQSDARIKKDKTKTAEQVFAFAEQMEEFDVDALKVEMKSLTRHERSR